MLLWSILMKFTLLLGRDISSTEILDGLDPSWPCNLCKSTIQLWKTLFFPQYFVRLWKSKNSTDKVTAEKNLPVDGFTDLRLQCYWKMPHRKPSLLFLPSLLHDPFYWQVFEPGPCWSKIMHIQYMKYNHVYTYQLKLGSLSEHLASTPWIVNYFKEWVD